MRARQSMSIKAILLLRVMYWEAVEFRAYCRFRRESGWVIGAKPEGPLFDLFELARRTVHCALEDFKYGYPMFLYPSVDDRIYRRNPSLRPKKTTLRGVEAKREG